MSFVGFFQYDEVANLHESDITFFEDHIEVVKSSKTDQHLDGARVVIACTASATCPVRMMERYRDEANIISDEKFMFRRLVSSKSGTKLRSSGNLIYTRVRELVLDMLAMIGLDRSKYGLHSLHTGDATAAKLHAKLV